ncbi:MAG: hypothetical protein RBR67_20820 [Desulfobacterium sp.]|nr:hypothetical protein [Desulfobacterium sp.]
MIGLNQGSASSLKLKTYPPINVTQPFLPPLPEVTNFTQEIWDRKWLTNSGAFHRELEAKIAQYLDVLKGVRLGLLAYCGPMQ